MSSLFGTISGLFEDKRVPKKKVYDKESPEHKKILSKIIRARYRSSGFLKDMAAEKEYQKFIKETKDNNSG